MPPSLYPQPFAPAGLPRSGHAGAGAVPADLPHVRGSHGGGAFSGKDPSKVDRSAAYMGRYVAKNIVAAGLAAKAQVQVAYAIGISQPVSVSVETYGTGVIPDDKISALVLQHFDMRPKAIIQNLNLLRPIYKQTAAYGHFGREYDDFTWERTDMAEILKADAGI